MMRYNYYHEKVLKENFRELTNTFRKLGRPVDVKKFVNGYVDGTYTSEDLTGLVFGKTHKINMKDSKIIDLCKSIVLLSESEKIRLNSINLWADEDKWYELFIGVFDNKVWKNVNNRNFCLEYNIKESNDNTYYFCTRAIQLTNTIIQVSTNMYGKGTMRQFAKVFINLDSGDIYAQSKDNSYNTESIKVGQGTIKVYKVGLDKSEDSKSRDMENDWVAMSVLSMQSAICEYDKFNNSVKDIKTISGAKRRVERLHKPRVSVITNEDGKDTYIPVSELAIKRVYERKEWQGGHHSSPVPHNVSGHWREYKSGKRVWVKGYHKQSPKYNGEKGQKVYVLGK